MIPLPIQDWNIFLRDGNQFLKTATAAHIKKKPGFSAETIYNLVCMGIEKLIMAFLMQRGDLAENHTMTDLLAALERHLGKNEDIERELRFLDTFQEICDLETYVVRKPDQEDLERMIAAGTLLQNHLSPFLNQTGSCQISAAPHTEHAY